MRTSMTILATALGALSTVPAVASAALPAGNLLANPGFELGPTAPFTADPQPIAAWTSTSTQKSRATAFVPVGSTMATYHADQVPGGGCRGMVGPLAPKEGSDGIVGTEFYSAYQEVPLTAEAAGKTLRVGGLLGRYGQSLAPSGDYGALRLYFVQADGQLSDVAGFLNNYSSTDATTVELTRKQTTASVPAGAKAVRVYASSVAVGFGAARGYANGLVDDVALTFDAALPADPPIGCQKATPTTGGATDASTSAARLLGTIDTKHENVKWSFRFGANGALDRSSAEMDLAAADGASAVSQTIDGLAPSTSYSYTLVARTVLDGQSSEAVVGPTRTFSTPAATGVAGVGQTPAGSGSPGGSTSSGGSPSLKRNSFKSAVKISGPKGGCVKAGSTFRVSVTDKAQGTRKLTRFLVLVGDGVHRPRTTVGPTGKTTAAARVRRIYTSAPKGKRSRKLTLLVVADFAGLPDPRGPAFGIVPGSQDSVVGQKQFKFCAPHKK